MRIVLALALVAAVFAPLPVQADSDVTELPGDPSGSATCGPDTLRWNLSRSTTPGMTGSFTLDASAADGTSLLHVAETLPVGAAMRPRWCADLLHDGSQVLAYDLFSGGAHCCFSSTLVQLEGAGTVLDVNLGNGGLGMPAQLSADGPMQLVGSSDVFAYFDDLSFAASPFMPLVFAYDDASQQYVEATRQFPDYLREQIAKFEADLPQAVARSASAQVPPQFRYQEQESIALHLYGLHLLLGDAGTALPRLEARVSPRVAAWLEANAPAAAAAIDSTYYPQ